MIFRVNVANERGRALLDSGASIDIVDRRFVEKLKPRPNKIKQGAQITLGDNSVIKSTEACELTLVINNKSMKGEFQVIDLPETFQLIMGMRFLRKHDCRPILSQRTASFRPDGTGDTFVAAGLTMMTGGLPHSDTLTRRDVDGAIFLLDTDTNAAYDNDVNQYEILSEKEFKAALATATAAESKRRKMSRREQERAHRTEPEAFLVEDIEQFLPGLSPKAERALRRERQSDGLGVRSVH